MTNYDALLTLIGDINNAFCHVEDEDAAAICDGDIKLLDKAVTVSYTHLTLPTTVRV